MQATFDRSALADCLNIVAGTIAHRSPKPVLTCVRLAVQDNAIEVSGTDTEVSIVMRSNHAEITEPGEVVIPAASLQQIVRECPNATLTVESQGESAIIKGGRSKFELLGYPTSDFPTLQQQTDTTDSFSIQGRTLHHLISCTLFATAKETSRFAINGVLFERAASRLNLVSTDGHRLALAIGQCTTANEENNKAIIPSKALSLIQRMFGEDDVIDITFLPSQAIFKTENATLTTNLIEGSFPPYQDVIPKDHDRLATFKRDTLLSKVRQASLLTSQNTNNIILELGEDGGELRSSAPEKGKADIALEDFSYEGESIRIAFNPIYLIDALKVMDQDEVKLELKASNKPGVLRAGQHFVYVIMSAHLS